MKVSLRQQLWLLIVLVFAAISYFSLTLLVQARDALKSAETVNLLVEVSVYNSLLVHEMQRERGASSGFLGSQGRYFRDVLANQRVRTDKKLTEFQSFAEEHALELANFPVVWANLQQVIEDLSELSDMRQQVVSQSISIQDVLDYYTSSNALLIQTPALAINYSHEAVVNRQLIAYHQLMQGKERTGLERAMLSNTFGRGEFAPGAYKRFIELVTEQTTYLSNYLLFATDTQKADYEAFLHSEEVALVNDYRNKAFTDQLTQDPEYWYIASSQVINILNSLEDQVSADILAQIEQIQIRRSLSFWLYLALALFFSILPLIRLMQLMIGMSRKLDSQQQAMDAAT